MKQLVIHGFALALGVVMASPATAQYGQSTWNETRDQYSSAYRSVSSPTRRDLYELQDDQESPSDLGEAPGERGDAPAPIAGDQLTPGNPCEPSAPCGGAYDCGPSSIAAGALGNARSSNWIVGVYGLGFGRDYEDDYGLSYNADPASLFSTDADHGFFGGIETMVGKRNCNGQGWEFRYWGLYPSDADATLLNGRTVVNGLQWLTDPGSGFAVNAIYNNATDHRIYRSNEFHNVEWNLLGNAGCRGKRSYEWLAGFRWLEFDENFRYRTSTTVGAYPPVFDYELDTSNTLLGFQMGGRKEICLCKGVRIHLGGKGGIFNNFIRHRQFMQTGAGVYAQHSTGPYTGNDFNYWASKNDIAMMGELDLGASWQFRECWRLRGGYRAVGVAGVALAPDQIPYNFRDSLEVQRINSNGSLILHGFYLGLERCF